jgi:hypothetical protein
MKSVSISEALAAYTSGCTAGISETTDATTGLANTGAPS